MNQVDGTTLAKWLKAEEEECRKVLEDLPASPRSVTVQRYKESTHGRKALLAELISKVLYDDFAPDTIEST